MKYCYISYYFGPTFRLRVTFFFFSNLFKIYIKDIFVIGDTSIIFFVIFGNIDNEIIL
jgi:hypothetical protein